MKPHFIVIEGLEGAGKSTAVDVVKQFLQKAGADNVVIVREPGGTPVAEKIRDIVKTKNPADELTAATELLLMIAGRVQLVEKVIKPALAQGHWVIADRHALSTRAYQGGGRQLSDHMIQSIHQLVLGEFTPDFTLYLDIEPQQGLHRVSKRGELDRIEQENAAFFSRVREKYLELVRFDPDIAYIDAGQSMDRVAHDIHTVLTEHYSYLLIP